MSFPASYVQIGPTALAIYDTFFDNREEIHKVMPSCIHTILLIHNVNATGLMTFLMANPQIHSVFFNMKGDERKYMNAKMALPRDMMVNGMVMKCSLNELLESRFNALPADAVISL